MQYWATATAYRAFGERNWTARVWLALTGLLGVILMYVVGARLYGRTAGLYTGLVLASSVLYLRRSPSTSLQLRHGPSRFS